MLLAFLVNQKRILDPWRIRRLILNQDIRNSYAGGLRIIARSKEHKTINKIE